ncbi:MAG: hypothetical protein AAF705_03165, partial [Bacteroidota bacterium]
MNLKYFKLILLCLATIGSSWTIDAQGTRLLRAPTLSANQVAFTYGSDLWIADRDGQNLRRIT